MFCFKIFIDFQNLNVGIFNKSLSFTSKKPDLPFMVGSD